MKHRKWQHYHNRNSGIEKHSSNCQLVTTLNFYYYKTGNFIERDSKRYIELCELARCNHGSCICIEEVWKELDIKIHEKINLPGLWQQYLKEKCFIELHVSHPKYGQHSIAIIEYSKRLDAIRVANFSHETSTKGWMFIENLRTFLVPNPNNDKDWGRIFKLKE